MKKRRLFLPIALMVLVVIVAVSVLLLTNFGRTEINPSLYLRVDFAGQSTMGTAESHFDAERMVAENLRAFGLNKNASESDIRTTAAEVTACLTGRLDKTDHLANGAQVIFIWDEEGIAALEEAYRVTVEDTDPTFIVTGLQRTEQVDLFSGIAVTYTGKEPDGKISLSTTGAAVQGLVYTAEPAEGLRNGDTVTVTVTAPDGGDLQAYLLTQNKTAAATTKQYIVEGLS